MALVNSFAVLQQFSASISHADLCESMDLCALATEETLSIHRTISWEQVYFTKTSESFDSAVTSLLFSSVSKLLTIGLADGSVALLDIETGDIVSSRRTLNSSCTDPVLSMAWQRLPSLESSALDTERLAVHGGLHQLQRGGMSEYSDPNGLPPMNIVDGVSLSLTSPVPARRELTYQLSGHLLLALTHDGSVDGYVLGVYPLFSIAPGLLSTTPRCLLALPMGRTDAICFDTNAGSGVVGSQAALFRPAQHMRLRWLEHCGSLHLCIESNLSRLHDLILSCGRKWKDACKVVLPKLSLMQTLLASYEMQMTPIEFCYTITACGLWHPAAATAFSQHWNDQGIQRLRAAVDASSRSVVKLLQTKALPMVTNSLLCARELLGVTVQLIGYTGGDNKQPNIVESDSLALLAKHKALVQRLERVVLLLDAALVEARLAREAMLLYIQFIKDCAYDAALSENTAATNIPGTKPDISLRPKYRALFDPRCHRALSTGAAAQAEHVTGTHLYAFLQDHAPTSASKKSSNNNCSSSASGAGVVGEEVSAAGVRELFTAASKLADAQLSASLGVERSSALDSSSSCSGKDMGRSLVHEIKMAKEEEQGIFYSIHQRTSAALAHSLTNAAPATTAAPTAVTPTATRVTADAALYARHATAVSHLALKVSQPGRRTHEDLRLQHCVVEVTAHTERGVLCIVLRDLTNQTMYNSSSYTAQLSLSSVVAGLQKAGDSANNMSTGSDEAGATAAHVVSAQVCVYCRSAPSDDAKDSTSDVSVLLALEVRGAATTDGVFLCKLALEDIVFTKSTTTASADTITAGAAHREREAGEAQAAPEDALHSRKLSLKSVARLRCSGTRGVALVGDAAGRIVIVDVEADDEEGTDDEEEDHEEEGDESAAVNSALMDESA